MADDSGKVRDTLHALYLHAQTDAKARPAAKAALGAELDRLLYKTDSPDEGARAFLVDILFETAKAGKAGAARVDAMAFGDSEKEHPENRRAAGIVHVTRSSQIADRAKRKQALKADAKDARLDSYARNLSGLLLVQQWREELKQNMDVGVYAEAKEFMDNEADYLRATRVEVAKFLLDFCKKKGKALPVVAEMATCGKWPELAEEAGKWLVDHYMETKDLGMAKRVVESPNTPEAVRDYAAERFDGIGFRPIDPRMGNKTMTGMPAFRPQGTSVPGVKGVPPSPEDMRKITIKGPVR
ncbi:MAG: hypothetical protein AB1657_05210 [Candidatus Micrarchaeota archaeon]